MSPGGPNINTRLAPNQQAFHSKRNSPTNLVCQGFGLSHGSGKTARNKNFSRKNVISGSISSAFKCFKDVEKKKKGVKNRRKNDIMTLCFLRVEETGRQCDAWWKPRTKGRILTSKLDETGRWFGWSREIQHILENHTICLMFVYIYAYNIDVYIHINTYINWLVGFLNY